MLDGELGGRKMGTTRLRVLVGLLAVVLAASVVAYLLYFRKLHSSPGQVTQPSSNQTTPSTTTATVPPSTPPATSAGQLQLPTLEELTAKTVNWLTYENQDYGFKVKYPSGWGHWDKTSFPQGISGQLMKYKAIEIFRSNKLFDSENGAGVSVYYSDKLSLIPTKGSIANDFEKEYQWHIKHQINTFSLGNGFEGVVGIGEGNSGRAQLGEAFRKFGDKVFYVEWYLTEDYQSGKSSYPDITYQNQFLPFLASFEITN